MKIRQPIDVNHFFPLISFGPDFLKSITRIIGTLCNVISFIEIEDRSYKYTFIFD
jgi:hypothetical protein